MAKTKSVDISAFSNNAFQLQPGFQYTFGEVGLLSPRPGGNLVPVEYSGWREETNSWKYTAYLGTNLTGAPTYKISGPDAIQFLSDTFVNGLKKFPIGSGRHGIMCREDGTIMVDGVIIRTGDEEFITYWMAPYIQYALEKGIEEGRYQATGEDMSGSVYLFQLAGPRSLEILEKAAQTDLHDLKFMRHRDIAISGKSTTVLRLGMAGTLAYEIHGPIEDANAVYQKI